MSNDYKSKYWRIERLKRLKIPDIHCRTNSSHTDGYMKHFRMGCWNDLQDLSFVNWGNLIQNNRTDNRGWEFRMRLNGLENGQTIPSENIACDVRFGVGYNGWNSDSQKYGSFWYPDKNSGTVIYKYHDWYASNSAFDYRHRDPNNVLKQTACYGVVHGAWTDSNHYYGQGIVVDGGSNHCTGVYEIAPRGTYHCTHPAWFYKNSQQGNLAWSRSKSQTSIPRVWTCYMTQSKEYVVIFKLDGCNTMLLKKDDMIKGIQTYQNENYTGGYSSYYYWSDSILAKYYGDDLWWNICDMNDNNVFVSGRCEGIFFTRFKSKYFENGKVGSIFATPRIDDRCNNGTVYKNTIWRSVDTRFLNQTPQYPTVGGHAFIRINNDNNVVFGEGWAIMLAHYNTRDDQVEYAENIDLLPSFTSHGLRHPYISSAINNKNEVVLVDGVNGYVDILKVEPKKTADPTTVNTSVLSTISKQRQNTENIDYSDIDQVRELMYMEVKFKTGSICEIIVSPHELEENDRLMLLDGRSLLKENYPFLYNILGDKYNDRDTPSTHFKLPNVCGRYLQGRTDTQGFETNDSTLQSFVLESIHEFGFSPISNQIKKYFKYYDRDEVPYTKNVNSKKLISEIKVVKNTINSGRKSTSIDDKCYLFYIKVL